MLRGLGEKGHTRFRKKKKEKLIVAKSGLAGMKRYLETYDRVKHFLPCLSRF